jgi:hypothetical protein
MCFAAVRVAEKSQNSSKEPKERTSGAKAHVYSSGFIPGINPRPTARMCFFAALFAGLLLCVSPAARAEAGGAFAAGPSRSPIESPLPDRLPDKPSLPPEFSIRVDTLGFSAPGSFYLGQRVSLVSLDFLDEEHLLFTFRVPGLIRREPGESAESDERQIRAVVVALPAGNVVAEAQWSLHDHARYLWMLKDGHFLLRDRDNLQQGDATLELKPLLHFPGPLLWMEIDPTQQFLVTNSREPAAPAAKPQDVPSPASQPSDQSLSLHPNEQKSLVGGPESPGTPSTASADTVVDGQKPPGRADSGRADLGKTELVVRVLHRTTGQVMLVSRVNNTVHLPINADGYVERLRGKGTEWLLNLNLFTGGSTILGRVDSTCSPALDFISQRELLVTACASGGGRKLVAMATDGRRLWDDTNSARAVWPLVVMAPNGLRLAQETLAVTHPISPYTPLDREDVRGQLVRVFDAATGKITLEAPASPALDEGGNVAISPSGRRVAILNAGAIQIFELPPSPPLPDAATAKPDR